MRLSVAAVAISAALVVLLTGCTAGSAPQQAETPPSPRVRPVLVGPDQSTAPVPSKPGTTVAGVTLDRAASTTEYASAYSEARRGLETVLNNEYLGSEFASPTPRVSRLARTARLELAPLCAVTTPAVDPSSVFANTVAIRGQYVALLSEGDRLIGAYDWGSHPDQLGTWSGRWGSFYSGFSLDFRGAAERVKSELGAQPVRLRFVRAPHGYWVVGRSGSKEVASFVAHEGLYLDAPLELASPQQAIEYTTRDHSAD